MRFAAGSRLCAALGLLSSVATASPTEGLQGRDSSTGSTNTAGTSAEVAFLQTLQTAQVSSMSCLITLVNMTVNPIGTCLGLTSLSQLIVAPSTNSSFSTQLSSYLGTVCGAGQCTDASIADAKGQLAQNCQMGGTDNTLISVLDAILDNYQNSYHTLACSVHL